MAARIKTLAYLAGGGVGVYMLGRQLSDFKTPGVRNIERRHTAAGGAPNHQPASHTPMGKEDDVTPVQVGVKGVGTKYFSENFGKQTPDDNELAKKWAKTHYDSEHTPRG